MIRVLGSLLSVETLFVQISQGVIWAPNCLNSASYIRVYLINGLEWEMDKENPVENKLTLSSSDPVTHGKDT